MLIKISGGLLLTLFLLTIAEAQHPKEVRIAVLGAPEEPRFSEIVAGLKRGLEEAGYRLPSLAIEEIRVRRAEEKNIKPSVRKALQRDTRVFFLIGSRLLKPVREVSASIPVVFITPGDPVASGLVASLARPGGNTTAMTFEFPELSGKRLELLKEIAPRVRRVLAIYMILATLRPGRASSPRARLRRVWA